MTRILVTGATGFIGQATLPLLVEEGYEVHGVTGGRSPIPPTDGIRWHNADLLDPDQTTAVMQAVRPDRLLHLAWCASPGQWLTSIQNVRWTEASLYLVRQFAAYGGERVVVSGSCAEYDLFHGYCSETTTPLRPVSLYGQCKHAAQTVLAGASAELGLRIAWARIFYVYGPAEHPLRLVASVIRSLLEGRPAGCNYGGHLRDYLHSHDVGSALVHLLGGAVDGPVNVGSGIPVSLQNLVLQIGEQMGHPELIAPSGLETSKDEPSLIVADVRRLRDVGWSPSLTLETGLSQTILWWRENP